MIFLDRFLSCFSRYDTSRDTAQSRGATEIARGPTLGTAPLEITAGEPLNRRSMEVAILAIDSLLSLSHSNRVRTHPVMAPRSVINDGTTTTAT